MIARMNAMLAAMGIGLLLGGCGPVYRTEYSFVPPPDPAGRQCLNQCLGMRQLCRATAESRAARDSALCQQQAMLSYTTCLAGARDEKDRGRCSHSAYCDQSADFSECQAEYRACYQNCGGIVNSYTRCVSGC